AISLGDYYRLQAFFVRGQPGDFELKDPALWKEFRAAVPPEYEPARQLYQALLDGARARLVAETRASLSLEARTALNTPAEKRTPEQVKLAAEADVKQQFSTGKLEKTIRPEDQK